MGITLVNIIVSFVLGSLITLILCIIKINKEKEKNVLLIQEKTRLESEINALNQIKTNEDKLYEIIKKEFNSSANEVLLEKQKSLQEENNNSLNNIINPLKEKIKEFQEKVEKADEAGKLNTATLKQKIEDLVKQNQITLNQTEKLSNAISQNSKFRGSMGEMILDKLLKSSGLIDKKDNPYKGNYETQKGFKDASGIAGTKIVDAIVYLSESNKCIVIDSKASLVDFISFMNSDNEDEKNNYLNSFLADVSNRVKELSNKYTNLEGLNTPDFTIMFIPFEAPVSYIYSDNKLIEDAIKQNVIISGPSTLIATLRTINYSWAQKNQYDNIKDITKLGSSIYDKCVTLIQKIENVQTSFDTVRKKFDDLFTTLKGRGGLFGQVEKLKELGLSPSKEIEAKYLEETQVPLLAEINN